MCQSLYHFSSCIFSSVQDDKKEEAVSYTLKKVSNHISQSTSFENHNGMLNGEKNEKPASASSALSAPRMHCQNAGLSRPAA